MEPDDECADILGMERLVYCRSVALGCVVLEVSSCSICWNFELRWALM